MSLPQDSVDSSYSQLQVQEASCEELSEFLTFQESQKTKESVDTITIVEKEDEEDSEEKTTPKTRRKRKLKTDGSLDTLNEDFLKVHYPISSCLNKNVSAGISKQDNFEPSVVISQNAKRIVLNETSWESFNKYLKLIECYLSNRVHGKKTTVVLDQSDIEVENVKMRGLQYVKFKDGTKHDEKVVLSPEEFDTLVLVVPVINRYMKQLRLSLPMIKDYLNDTLESATPLLYGPVDVSIYNRLPQEVYLFRNMKAKRCKLESGEESEDDMKNSTNRNVQREEESSMDEAQKLNQSEETSVE